MRKLLFVSIFAILLLGGQKLFFNELAHARHNPNHCCMCGTCNTWCWCSGQANCKCTSYDGKNIGASSSMIKIKLDVRDTSELEARSDTTSTEGVMTLVRGDRMRDSFAVKLIDHVADHMKFKCMNIES